MEEPMNDKNQEILPKFEENQGVNNKAKSSLSSVVIVLTITLFAIACTFVLGMFRPAISLSVQGTVRSVQKRYSEAAIAYEQIPALLSGIEERIPETLELNFNSLYGVEYNLFKVCSKLSRMSTGDMISRLPKVKQQQFPFSRLKAVTEDFNAFNELQSVLREELDYFYDEDTENYKNVMAEPIFAALDNHAAKYPKTPAWAVAILKNYVGGMVEEDAETRLKYFDGVINSDNGIEEYTKYLLPILRELNRTDDMLDLFERRIAINRNDTEAHLGKGKIFIAAGNSKRLRSTIRSVERYAKNSGIPEALRIEALRRDKNYSEAVKVYTAYEAVQHTRGSAGFFETIRQIAIVYILQGDYHSAFETALNVVEMQNQIYSNTGYVEYAEEGWFLMCLAAELAGENEFIAQYQLEQNEAGLAVLKADDRKTALAKLFLEGKGDIA